MPAFELQTQSLERTIRPASDDSKSRAPSATQSRIQPGLRPYGDRASWVPSVAQSVLSPPTRGQDPIDLDQLLEQPTSVGHILYPLTQNSLQPRIALDPPPIGPHALGKYKDPSSDTAPRRGRVVVRFVPANSNEIQLEVNDIVTILSEYWIGVNRFFYGRCDSTSGHQRNGFFPRSHILLLDDLSASNSALWSEPLQRAPHSPSISGEVYCGADCFIRQIARFALHVSTLHPAKLLVECPDFWTPTTISTIFPTKLRPWQTRLIHLKPGSEESDLECDLLVVDLIDGQGCVITDSSTTVQYEALSYSWGEASIRSSSSAYQHMAHITVNGTNWAISTDLANALLHVRSKQDGRYLWCDALCINQHDSDEKAAQIKGMLRIFEKAKNVIAWLGVAHPSSGRLIRAFEVMSPHIDLLAQRHTVACSNILDGIKAAMISHVSN
ncbi:hypothetical protein Dsin_032782 [Dipteronia sinensis]|uniref:SH3 domain-containing protein n=1 Tax=Dipteronia sinensis TaxID=43782 RepID=A0AAE0DQ82_9ROSI|nr:hypothetical protein Dsin_032782 [Dipteronia sinensis]